MMERNVIIAKLAASANTELAAWATAQLANTICWLDLYKLFNQLSQPARLAGLAILYNTNDTYVAARTSLTMLASDWPALATVIDITTLTPEVQTLIGRMAASDTPRIVLLGASTVSAGVKRICIIQALNKASVAQYATGYFAQFLNSPRTGITPLDWLMARR